MTGTLQRIVIPQADVEVLMHPDGSTTVEIKGAPPPIKVGQTITVSNELLGYSPIFAESVTGALQRALNRPRFTPHVGDKVTGTGISSGRTRTGYVVKVNPREVRIAEVEHRDPYGQYEPSRVVLVRPDASLKLIEAKPDKPKAGDVLTGEQVRGVPWKRGSVIKLDEPRGNPILLTEDGDWLPVVSGRSRIPFGELAAAAKFVVIHVGK